MPELTMTLEPLGLTLDTFEIEYPEDGTRATGRVSVTGDHQDALETASGFSLTVNGVTWGPFRSLGDVTFQGGQTSVTIAEAFPAPDPAPALTGGTVGEILAELWPGVDVSAVPAPLLGAAVNLDAQGKGRREVFDALLGGLGFRLIDLGGTFTVNAPARQSVTFHNNANVTREARRSHTLPSAVTVTGGKVSALLITAGGLSGPTPKNAVQGSDILVTWHDTLAESLSGVTAWIVSHQPENGTWEDLATLAVAGSAEYTYVHQAPGVGNHSYRVTPVTRSGQVGSTRTIRGLPGPTASARVDGELGKVTLDLRPDSVTIRLPGGAPNTKVTASGPSGEASTQGTETFTLSAGGTLPLAVHAGETYTLTFERVGGGASYPQMTATIPEQGVTGLKVTPAGRSAVVSWSGEGTYVVEVSGQAGIAFRHVGPQRTATVTGLSVGTAYTVKVWPEGSPTLGAQQAFSTLTFDLSLSPEEVFEASQDGVFVKPAEVREEGEQTITVEETLWKAGGNLVEQVTKTTTSMPDIRVDAKTGARTDNGLLENTEVSHSVFEYGYPQWPTLQTGSSTVTTVTSGDATSETRTRTWKLFHPRGWLSSQTTYTDTAIIVAGVETSRQVVVDVTRWTRTGAGTWNSTQSTTTAILEPVIVGGKITGYRTVRHPVTRSGGSSAPEMVPEPATPDAPLELGNATPPGDPAWDKPIPNTDGYTEGANITGGKDPEITLTATRAGPGKANPITLDLSWSADPSVIAYAADFALQHALSPQRERDVTYWLPAGAVRGGSVRSVSVAADRQGDPWYQEAVKEVWTP